MADLDKHTKGYIYDSLVYRYIRAREAMGELEVIKFNNNQHQAARNAQRDILRFCEILNEVLGEHD